MRRKLKKMARAKRLTERIDDLENITGIKETLDILFVSFLDSEGRRCKACYQYEAFRTGLTSDASGIKVFIPACEGCQKPSKEVEQ